MLLAGLIGGFALVLTAVLTPVVRSAAISVGIVRQVQADRWHARPTPAIGGVAIFLGFGLAVTLGFLVDATFRAAGSEPGEAAGGRDPRGESRRRSRAPPRSR